MTSTARWITLLLAIALIAIIVAADRAALPGILRRAYAFPGGDKVGHAVLFGGLAGLATLAFPRRTLSAGSLRVPAAAAAVAIFATLEEASQAAFPGRTLSLADLAASYVGIALGTAAARLTLRRSPRR